MGGHDACWGGFEVKRNAHDASQATHVHDALQQANAIQAALRARVTRQQNIGMIDELTASAANHAPGIQPDVVSLQSDAERLEVLEVMYDDHSGAVYAFAKMVFGSSQAEEITRQVFAAACHQPGQLNQNDETLRLRLVLGALSHAPQSQRDSSLLARSEKRRRRVVRRLGARSHVNRHPGDGLERALEASRLNLTERTVLALILIARCSYHEVALILGRSESDVLQQARSVLTRLSNTALVSST